MTAHIRGIDGDRKVAPLNFLWLELTNRCNLKCVHCYAGSSPGGGVDDRLTTADYLRALDEAAQLGCRSVQFIGGEPTLHPDLVVLIRQAKRLRFEFVEVFSNLIRLPPAQLDAFKAHGVHLATSIYSATPEVHDRITERVGSHTRTVSNLKAAVAAGVPLRASIIDIDGIDQDIPGTRRWLEALGVTRIGVDQVRSFGRAAAEATSMSELCGSCANGTLCVGYDGRVSPCIMSKPWSIGSVLDTSLMEIASSRRIAATRDAIRTATDRKRAAQRPLMTEEQVGRGCQPSSTGPCNPDQGGSCTPCSPTGNCGPNTCGPRPF